MALSLIILSQLLFSCGTSPAAGPGNDTETQSGETSTEESTTSAEIQDDLPEADYEGKTFTTITFDQLLPDYEAETENGDVINDAVYARNRNVSERFNVKIETMSNASYEDTTNFIKKTTLAGEEAFQLIAQHAVSMGTLAMDGLFMNWYDIPYIDFSKPWWSKSTTEDLTYGGDYALLAVGDYALSAALARATVISMTSPARRTISLRISTRSSERADGRLTI